MGSVFNFPSSTFSTSEVADVGVGSDRSTCKCTEGCHSGGTDTIGTYWRNIDIIISIGSKTRDGIWKSGYSGGSTSADGEAGDAVFNGPRGGGAYLGPIDDELVGVGRDESDVVDVRASRDGFDQDVVDKVVSSCARIASEEECNVFTVSGVTVERSFFHVVNITRDMHSVDWYKSRVDQGVGHYADNDIACGRGGVHLNPEGHLKLVHGNSVAIEGRQNGEDPVGIGSSGGRHVVIHESGAGVSASGP